MIPNSLARKKTLSFRARGLLVMALSMKEDWDMNLDWMCSETREGPDAIRTAMRELEAAGHVVYTQEREAFNKFSKAVWTFHDTPVEQAMRSDPKKRTGGRKPSKPGSGNPLPGKPGSGKPQRGFPGSGNPVPKKDNFEEVTIKEVKEKGAAAPSTFTGSATAARSASAETPKEGPASLEAAPPREPAVALRRAAFAPPSAAEAAEFAAACGCPPADGEAFFHGQQARGWQGVRDWRAKFRQYAASGWLPSQKQGQPRNPPSHAARQGSGLSGYNL